MMHVLWRYLQGRKSQSPDERREAKSRKDAQTFDDIALKDKQIVVDRELKDARTLSDEELWHVRELSEEDLREARESVDRLRQQLAVISRHNQR